MGIYRVVKMIKVKGEIYVKIVLEGFLRGVRVEIVIQRERSLREREVELGLGLEIGIEVG